MAYLASLAICLAFAFHGATALMAWHRLRQPKPQHLPDDDDRNQRIALIIPIAHIERHTPCVIKSAFGLERLNYELIFCVPSQDHPAVPLIEKGMGAHPHVEARVLCGREQFSFNPKLDNLDKAWAATRHCTWILIADSNVMMPPDFIFRLRAAWQQDTGLTCSPPVGCDPDTFWGDVECAFLNTYQGRIQLASDWLGFGFAHGKAMLFKRSLLGEERGLAALKFEVAEDCAATKLVRAAGKRVRLVDHPFAQPVAERTFSHVWHRHLRWAQLRRQSFPTLFAMEILTTSFVPGAAAGLLAHDLAAPPLTIAAVTAASLLTWLTLEAALAKTASWPLRWTYLPACLCRDAMMTAIWFIAWGRTAYHWHGNPVDMTQASRHQP